MKEIIVNKDDFVNGFKRSSLARSLTNSEYQIILFPTEQCNFRCVYCYEDFEKGNMPGWLIESVKSFITTKMQNLNKMTLSWFGGEPLLAKDILFEIAQHAYEMAEKHDCELQGDLTTNGSLLSVKTLERLVALKQNTFQISIDGDADAHNKTRVTRNGGGSFDKIWERLLAAAATDLNFEIMIRIHVTDLNQESVLRFCQRYEEYLASDPRFVLYFKAIESLGGDKPDQVKKLINKRTAREFAADMSKRFKDSIDLNRKGNNICYASKPNSIAIRSDGTLNKCTVALSEENNNVGRINEDGTLEINNQHFSSWIQGFASLDSWQLGCPWSYMHNHTVGDIPIKKVG